MVDRAEADAFVRAIGQVLRTERKRLGLTQAELGHRVVLSHSVMSKYESGTRRPDWYGLLELCAALDLSPAKLIAAAQGEAYPLGWPECVR